MHHVFVDTAAWIALINADDWLHQRAVQVMSDLRRQKTSLLTTEFVLLEVADALSSPLIREQTVVFINQLRSQPTLRNKEWGLTDCTSFVVMTQERITQAFTSDLEQAGFTKLL